MRKTPITYYGGKQSMLKHILPLIPDHKCYTEPFCGGAAVFFAKEPCDVEVINDINSNLINFYRVLKSNSETFIKDVNCTLYSRNEHVYASFIYAYPEYFNDDKRAWSIWVLSKMSFASKLDGSFGYDKTKNTTVKKFKNSKNKFHVEYVTNRLENTQVECTDALRIIKSRDHKHAFHFVDPPYIDTDCGHYNGYTKNDFIELCDLLSTVEGMFMLTMFPHKILDMYIKGNRWRVIEVERTISASRTKRRKQKELIVMNY